MNWEKVFTAATGIDEPAEGAELDWAEREFHGEELTPTVEDDWPACPRATLAHGDCDRASLKVVVAASKTTLAVVDFTDTPFVPVPGRGEVFIRGCEGEDFDETRLYFDAVYAGAAVYADYRYYPEEATFHGFVAAAEGLYFCERRSARWRRWDGAAAKEYARVKPEAEGAAFVADAGDEPWALTAGPALLARFDRRFSGYLDVRGVELAGREYLGRLALAAGAQAALSPAGDFSFGGAGPAQVLQIPASAVYEVRGEAAAAREVRVDLSYRGGRARAGAGAVTYYYDNPLISSKAHAQIICDALAARHAAEGEALVVEADESYAARPGTTVRLTLGPRGEAALYRVVAAARDLERRSVELTLTALAPEGNANVVD